MRQRMDQLKQLWCRQMHAGAMWPFRGQYRCRVCLREYPVAFEAHHHRAGSRDAVNCEGDRRSHQRSAGFANPLLGRL